MNEEDFIVDFFVNLVEELETANTEPPRRRASVNVDPFDLTNAEFSKHFRLSKELALELINMIEPVIEQRSQIDIKIKTWTMSAVLINMLGQGMILGYPFSLLPALNHPDSPIKADLHTSSWLGSITGVAHIPGFVVSSVLMAVYGRKLTHVFVMVPGIIGWVTLYYAKDIHTLMTGRFLCGLSTGATVFFGAIVIGEYTAPKYRGVFLYLKNASACAGAMCAHILSQYLHWRTIALVSSLPLIITLLITFTWPESSAWLASKHKYEQSEKSFFWIRGNTEASKRELEEVIKAQKAKLSIKKHNLSYRDKIITFYGKFKQKDFIKPIMIMVFSSIVQEVSGRHVFPTYALQIINEITGGTTQSFSYTLAIDITITISALFGSVLSKYTNRRTLLFSSGFSAVLVLMSVCIYLVLACKGIISSDRSWIPISLLGVYFVLTNCGCAPMPLTLVGEIFPLAHRGAGSAFSGVWISICLMVVLKSTPHIIVSTGVYGLFAILGTTMGLALLVLYFILPETKDRTLQEIENYFKYGNFQNSIVSTDDNEVDTKMITA